MLANGLPASFSILNARLTFGRRLGLRRPVWAKFHRMEAAIEPQLGTPQHVRGVASPQSVDASANPN